MLADWQIAETLEKTIEIEKPTIQKQLEELAQSTTECLALSTALKQEHHVLLEEKAQKLALVPSEWISRYHQMQTSVRNPIVPVQHGSCSACFYTLVQQEFSRIKKGEVRACQSCYRFLYFYAEKEQEHTQQ